MDLPQIPKHLEEEFTKEANNGLKEIHEAAVGFVDRHLKDGGKDSLAPTLFIMDHNGGDPKLMVCAILGDFNDHDGKHNALKALGAMLCKEGVSPGAVGIVSEAWISNKPGMMPSKDPQKREGIIIQAMAVSGACKFSTMEVKRVKNNIQPGTWDHNDSNTKDTPMPLLFSLLRGWSDAKLEAVANKMAEAKDQPEDRHDEDIDYAKVVRDSQEIIQRMAGSVTCIASRNPMETLLMDAEFANLMGVVCPDIPADIAMDDLAKAYLAACEFMVKKLRGRLGNDPTVQDNG